MRRPRFARSLGVASLALSCGCSLLFGLDGLEGGGNDGGSGDTGVRDDADGADGGSAGDVVTVDAADAGGEAQTEDAGSGSASDGDGDGGGADASAGDADAGSLMSGLVLYYAFDETSGTVAHDSSGNGHDGMLSGGATFSTGVIGNAVSLSGMSQYVVLPAGVTQSLAAFSITAWAHVNLVADAAQANWSRLFDLGTGTNTYAFLAPDNGGNGNLRFSITTSGNANEERIEAPMPLPTGMWEHLAVTSAGGIGTLYVNGTQVAQNGAMTLTLASLGATTRNWLGRSQFTNDPYLSAQIDELRLYSRSLSPTEVALLFAQH
jgi:hypothetical protein